jgi:hypothetical protein
VSARIDRTIDSIIGQLENLPVKLPNARAVLLTELNNIGAPGAAAYDGVKVTGGKAELTGVEAAADRRVHLNARLQAYNDELNAISLIVTNLLRDCDRAIGKQPEVYRCDSGVGRDGYKLARADGGWSELDCFNVPSEGRTTCDACRQRAGRWKRQQEGAVA